MRITIESTVNEPKFSIKSVVEVPYDDVLLDEVIELIRGALEGYGYYDVNIHQEVTAKWN